MMLLMTGVLLTPVNAAVVVKGKVFSPEQLKMGDLIAFDDESPFSALYDLSPEEFLNLKAKDLQELTGEKLSFAERMSFNIVKGQVKKQLKKAKKAASLDQVEKADAGSFKILWFLLGLFLPIIGLILALIIGGDGAVKSSLIGTAVALLIALLWWIF